MSTGADFTLPLAWADFDEIPILFANHFLVHHEADEFVLSLSQVTELPLVGTPEEMREQARSFDHVPIHTVARVGLTRQRVQELIGVLQAKLEEQDRAMGARQPA
jgi:hypothetical protein